MVRAKKETKDRGSNNGKIDNGYISSEQGSEKVPGGMFLEMY